MNTNTTYYLISRLAVSTCVCATVFLWMPAATHAASTAYPTDVVESPAIKKADIPAHFKRIFNREPTSGEVRYWETRVADKPTEYLFLSAMGYWAAQGESPALENSEFTLTLSGTGTDVFEGQTRRHTITLTHTNPIARSGYLDIKTNAQDVNPTAPLPNTQRTEVSGITRLRHHYTLAPEATLSVNFISTAPAPPSLNFEAILPGRGIQKKHVTKVYEAVPEELLGTTYHERHMPLLFARVFGRTPTENELLYWRGRLTKTKRLETIQGAMEVSRNKGQTMPGTVLGITTGVGLRDVNKLFRGVFGRTPTAIEWEYWAGRLHDKPSAPAYVGALEFHFLQQQ